MSDIYGLVDRRGAAIDPRVLASMGRALAPPGRARGTSWIAGPVGLGSGLDAVRDPARPTETPPPLTTRGGDLVLVANGHVDNRGELAVALGTSPDAAQAMSDAALILAAVDRYGLEALRRLVGEFSFAVWDAGRERLIAACSAPLARPLCYHVTGSALTIASRPRGLFATGALRRRLDEERLAGFLGQFTTDPSRTFFAGVSRLLPGQLLIAERGTLRVEQWWQPDLDQRLQPATDEDYAAALTALLEQVIAEQLPATGTPGMMLSGGLDSSSVAAVAAARLAAGGNRQLHAFTEVPRGGFAEPVIAGRYADETPFVQTIAGAYPNIVLDLVHARQGLLHGLERVFDAAEVPFRNAANRGWIEEICRRAADCGATPLLTGDQGNLTISWDGSGVLAELLRQGRVRAAIREAGSLAAAGPARAGARALLVQALPGLMPPPALAAAHRLRQIRSQEPGTPGPPSLITAAFAAEHRQAAQAAERRHVASGLGPAARLRTLVMTGSLTAELYAGYRRLYGIDVRTPLADRRLVEFCLATPEEQFSRAGQRRWLIRRTMAGRLPDAVLDKRDRGLQAADWFEQMSAERGELLEAALGFAKDDLVAHVIDVPRLQSLLRRWPDSAPNQPDAVRLYRGAVGLALMTGQFILWTQRAR